MRIALATSSFDPYVGGVEEHVRNVARRLRDRGHTVVVWTVERDGGHRIRQVDGLEVRDLPAPLPTRRVRSLPGFALRAARAALLWRRAYRDLRPDVIHVHCFGPNGTYGRMIAARTGAPLVLTSHGETLADDAGTFGSSRFAIDSLRKGLARAAAVTGCSRMVLDDLSTRFGLPPGGGTVVMNGIDPDEPIGEAPGGIRAPYIAAIGRLQRLKGFDLLVEAFARAALPEQMQLVIGGGGPEASSLRELAERLGVGDRVALPGSLDRATVGAVRRGATIGVVPSRVEPFGIAALEVWRAGTPLIATTRGGPPEFVVDGVDGVLVDPEDVDALAAALSSLATDAASASAIAAAGTARVAKFGWDRVVDAYERIYREVAGAQAETAYSDIT